jgi:hypothetical protein
MTALQQLQDGRMDRDLQVPKKSLAGTTRRFLVMT